MNFESSTILTYKLMFDEAENKNIGVTIYTTNDVFTGKVVKHDSNAVVVKTVGSLTMVKLEKIEALRLDTTGGFPT